jgi:membrane dipeptidase
MNRMGMLVDVSHISDNSFYDVLETSSRTVVATHSCCRALCDHPRNMTDDMIRELASAGGVIQINFYPLFLDGGFKSVLDTSGIMSEGERIEAEFIADPASSTKRAAWNRVQEQLTALARPSFRLIADHIDRVVQLVGIDHVGIGSDYDGIEVTPLGMEDISKMRLLLEELRSRGFAESDLSKIASENFFRILG